MVQIKGKKLEINRRKKLFRPTFSCGRKKPGSCFQLVNSSSVAAEHRSERLQDSLMLLTGRNQGVETTWLLVEPVAGFMNTVRQSAAASMTQPIEQ